MSLCIPCMKHTQDNDLIAFLLLSGFIGCGKMAQALAKGLVKASLCKPREIVLSDPYEPSLDIMTELGYTTTIKNENVRDH